MEKVVILGARARCPRDSRPDAGATRRLQELPERKLMRAGATIGGVNLIHNGGSSDDKRPCLWNER